MLKTPAIIGWGLLFKDRTGIVVVWILDIVASHLTWLHDRASREIIQYSNFG